MVPLRGDEFDDRVFGLLQAVARFLDHQLVDLRHVGGRQVALFAATVVSLTDHAGQGGFDVQQRTGHIHQHSVVHFTLADRQALDHIELVDYDLARLPEAQHPEGIGDLLERRPQGIQFVDLLAVTAHEQIEAVLDPHQLFAQGRHHRTHGIAVRTGQSGTLLVHHIVVGQGIGQPVLLFEGTDTWRLRLGLGHVEQQVLGQVFRCTVVDAVGALFDQALEFLVDLAQQGPHRSAIDHAAIGQAFDQPRGDLPEWAQRRALAEGFQACKNPGHIPQIGAQVLATYHADQGHLQGLAQLAQQPWQLGGAQLGQGLDGQRRRAGGHVRGKQAGFRQQLLTACGAQVVEQRQNHHGQVAPGALDAIQVHRQLQDGLHQHFQGFAQVADAVFHQRLGQVLHFLGQQRRPVELDHLQRAVDLMHIGQAEPHAGRILRVLDERLQGMPRLFKGLGYFAFDPFQGDIIVPITHSHSTHKPVLPIPCG